jgi:hypothetical protein
VTVYGGAEPIEITVEVTGSRTDVNIAALVLESAWKAATESNEIVAWSAAN